MVHSVQLMSQFSLLGSDSSRVTQRAVRGSISAPGGIGWFQLLAVVAAPLFEEYLFRGLVYKGMRRSMKPALAMVASAAIFAIVHPPAGFLPVFGLGIATAIAFERTGLLLAPILAHVVYNAAVVFVSRG